MNVMEPLVEMWSISARITLYILDAVPDEALADRLSTRGWSVGQHFAHLHNNRLRWLEGYPDLLAGLNKVAAEQARDKSALRTALEASAAAIARMIEQAAAAGKVRNFKRSPAAFTGYLVAHEAYHHGEIGVMLAQSGHRLDKDTAYGMWEWDKR